MLPQLGADFGRYQIVARLGRGGMGVVYSALHRDLEREVALKLLAPELADDEGYRNRFVREARVLARLDSPHVVRVFDAGEQDGWLFIATELIGGGDLLELLERDGPMAPGAALRMCAGIAEGLAAAHAAGILHRDIKPSNVLLRPDVTGALHPVLCDFGIAAVADVDHTRTQGVIGTPAYMAPERNAGAPASVASDVYAVGCVLWTAVSGSAPYAGSTLDVLIGHQNGPIPHLPAGAAGADRVNAVLARAMAKQPEDRYADAAELVAALREPAEPAEPTARPAAGGSADAAAVATVAAVPRVEPSPTVATDGSRPARSRRGVILAVVAAVAAVVLGSALGLAVALKDDPASSPTGSSPADETSPSASGTPRQATSSAAAVWRCWDGSEQPTASACGTPTGARGARYLFSGSVIGACIQDVQPRRSFFENCAGLPPSGSAAQVNISEWSDHAYAVAHYRREGGPPTRWRVPGEPSSPPLLAWTVDDSTYVPCCPYKIALLYPDAGWSITIYATSVGDRAALLDGVEIRPPDEIAGRRR